jgi:site-specific DNA-methyltransferase (adenine-specific)
MAKAHPRRSRCSQRCAYAGCRRSFTAPQRGRPQLYCSPACRAAAYRERGGPKQRGLVRLVQVDATIALAQLPAASVQLIVTDPPYRFDRGSTYFRKWFPDLPDEGWPALFVQLHRVLAPDATAYVFCDTRVHSIFDQAARQAGFRVRAPLVWDKLSIGLGSAWRAQYEFIAWYEKGSPAHAERHLGNVRRHARVRGYPSEKPVSLLRELIMQSSGTGELVLDPFCGSGNTGKAARQLGRYALLMDLDIEAAERRLRVPALRSAIAS